MDKFRRNTIISIHIETYEEETCGEVKYKEVEELQIGYGCKDISKNTSIKIWIIIWIMSQSKFKLY